MEREVGLLDPRPIYLEPYSSWPPLRAERPLFLATCLHTLVERLDRCLVLGVSDTENKARFDHLLWGSGFKLVPLPWSKLPRAEINLFQA